MTCRKGGALKRNIGSDGDIDDQSDASEDYDELLMTFISYGDLGIVMPDRSAYFCPAKL